MLKAPRLIIEPSTEATLPGRGFYQLEEDALYAPIDGYPEPAKFFSYLEADNVRFDLDLKGHLTMIEITLPRRRWTVSESISYPLNAKTADVRWTDFRKQLESPQLLTDKKQQNLMLKFSDRKPVGSYYLAEKIICQVDSKSDLIAIWITDIIDDVGGHEISAFRKAIRKSEQA